jgi:hypothetical protein
MPMPLRCRGISCACVQRGARAFPQPPLARRDSEDPRTATRQLGTALLLLEARGVSNDWRLAGVSGGIEAAEAGRR